MGITTPGEDVFLMAVGTYADTVGLLAAANYFLDRQVVKAVNFLREGILNNRPTLRIARISLPPLMLRQGWSCHLFKTLLKT
jgi:hypothetical protein